MDKRKNLKASIIADGCAKVQWNKINSLGLEKLIDKIIVTDDYGQGFGKPNKRSYVDMINYFNVKPNECVYVGDNPRKDFVGAKELGFQTVRIIREQGDHIDKNLTNEYEVHYVINNFKELQEILRGVYQND